MSKQTPTVSVLMTAYNREEYIAEAIKSVIQSDFVDFELIIVDDCSDDDTFDIARTYAAHDCRINVHKNDKNLGDYNNRNKAASLARGKYLKYWDSDDVLYPHALSVMVRCMQKFPAAGFGLVKPHVPAYNQPYPILVEHPLKELYRESTLFNNSPGSSIFTRELFEKVGGFSGKRYIGDYEFWMNCAITSPLVIIPGFLGWDRTHDQQERNFDGVKYEELRLKVFFDVINNAANNLDEPDRKKLISQRKISVIKNAAADFLGLRWKVLIKKKSLIKYLLQ